MYENWSYGEIAEAENAFNSLYELALSLCEKDTAKEEYEVVKSAMFDIGRMINYGEEQYNALP